MASKALKGLTIKIGADTSDLTKSLEKVEKQGRSLSSELGQINKLLKLDPSNTELLAQKQKVLADAISTTEEKLDTLKEAEKQVQAKFERGLVSEAHYRALQREIIETENKLDKYKNAAKETADAVEKLGKEAGDAADDLDDQADSAEDAEDATEDLDDSANDLAAGGLAALAAAAAAAVTAIVALAEESREYRNEMAKLDTAFQNVGFSSEAATKTYEALQSVVGETEQAVEAANHLARLCTTEQELTEWTEILTGVYATWGASLSVESLAEAANETARCGTVTGSFADSLNWAAKEGETFGVKLKANTEANKEWNEAVKSAASAEDYFNLALQECSSEQERQQLITKTLTKLYGSAATQYKKTNAEVIRANQATEKWNKATAKIGKTVEPVITDIKELGVTLLEDAEEPLEDIAKFIQQDVLPAIKGISNWVKSNGPTIKATLVGVTTALVAYKVATIAATIAHEGLKGALLATAAAEKALQLVQAATPWGLAAVAIAGVTTALIAYSAATQETAKPVDLLTEEEKELAKATKEAAESFREQEKATQESMASINAEMGNVQKMAKELLSLADASGKVEEKDRARAEFLIGELNEALGTEYSMVGGVIQQYETLEQSIYDVIQAKLANALLEEAEAGYLEAQQQKTDALIAMTNAEKEYYAQKEVYAEKERQYTSEIEQLEARKAEAVKNGSQFSTVSIDAEIGKKKAALEQEKGFLTEKETAWNDAAADFATYTDKIIGYETAQQFIIEGNYEAAKKVLLQKGAAFGDYGDTVDEETAKVLDALQMEAIQAGLKAQTFRRNWEAGVDGYTEDMVKEAEESYEEAMGAFETAYADAHGVGDDLGGGLSEGMESKRSSLYSKARSLVSGIIGAMRKEADSHSPARKTIDFGEDVGEGTEIGLENKTDDVKKAATDQAAAIIDAYSAQEVNAQKALRGIADQQAARYTSNQLSAATATSPVLEQILAAIREGQVLLLDGDAVVGCTADRYNRKLGAIQILTARGAK